MKKADRIDVMLDLETLGHTSKSVVVSIGAIAFNIETGKMFKVLFYEKIDPQTCLDVGLKMSAHTVFWWLDQSKEAQKELISGERVDLKKALLDFYDWFLFFKKKTKHNNIYIWGNGAGFDINLLIDAYEAVKLPIPWNFRNERDVRTLADLKPEIKNKIISETSFLAHHPIEDCKLQIKYVSETWKAINNCIKKR